MSSAKSIILELALVAMVSLSACKKEDESTGSGDGSPAKQASGEEGSAEPTSAPTVAPAPVPTVTPEPTASLESHVVAYVPNMDSQSLLTYAADEEGRFELLANRPLGFAPLDVKQSANGNFLYVLSTNDKLYSFQILADYVSLKPVDQVPVAQGSKNLILNSNNQSMYILARSSGKIVHVELSEGSFGSSNEYEFGTDPVGLIFHPSKGTAYLTSFTGDIRVLSVDEQNGELAVIETVSAGARGTMSMAFSADAEFLFVGAYQDGKLLSYQLNETGRLTLVEQYDAYVGVDSLKLHPNGNFLTMVNHSHGSFGVWVVDREAGTLTEVETTDLGFASPYNHAIHPSGDRFLAVGSTSRFWEIAFNGNTGAFSITEEIRNEFSSEKGIFLGVLRTLPGDFAADIPLTEVCDGKDNDKDGEIDNNAEDGQNYYLDRDADGFGNANEHIVSCFIIDHYVANSNDCNDDNILIYPGSPEVIDNVDNNCSGEIDDQESDARILGALSLTLEPTSGQDPSRFVNGAIAYNVVVNGLRDGESIRNVFFSIRSSNPTVMFFTGVSWGELGQDFNKQMFVSNSSTTNYRASIVNGDAIDRNGVIARVYVGTRQTGSTRLFLTNYSISDSQTGRLFPVNGVAHNVEVSAGQSWTAELGFPLRSN